MQTAGDFFSVFAQKESKLFKLKTGVFLFLVQNDHILLSRRFKTGIDDGMYVVPMGGLNGQETATAAIMREAEEETAVILKPENLQVCHVMHRYHPMPQGLSFEQIDIFYLATEYEGTIQNLEQHKCDELKFYPIRQLPKNTAPFIQYAVECYLNGQFFSEFGWEHLYPH